MVGLSAIKLAVDSYTSCVGFPVEQRNALIVHISLSFAGRVNLRSIASTRPKPWK
jgi:hypothetical protein